MNHEHAIDIICNILESKIYISKELLIKENFNEPLTGSKLDLNDQQMMYLFLEIEKQCKVHLKTELFAQQGFNSIEKAAEVLVKSM